MFRRNNAHKKVFQLFALLLAIGVLPCFIIGTVHVGAAEQTEQTSGEKMYFWPMEGSADDVISGNSFYFESFDDYTDGAYPESGAIDQKTSGWAKTDAVTEEVSEFTVAAWFCIPADVGREWNCLFSTGAFEGSDFIELYYRNGYGGNFASIRGSVGKSVDIFIVDEFDDYDNWHHAAFTYNAETQTFKGYFDGQLTVEQNVSNSEFTGFSDTIFYLGMELTHYVTSETYVDDMLFSYREYSAEEIEALYSAPAEFAAKYLPEPTATPEPTEEPKATEETVTMQPAATDKPADTATAAGTVPPATQKSGDNKDNETDKGGTTWLIIAAIAVVMIVAAVIAIAAVKRKKQK
ncbi:MAG: LamG domain-containing protein [Clostridia bacterium]|nr:LamG domain-containing protein [Clostridia bacterium]